MSKNLKKLSITNAILWAAAIIASAILGAPTFLTLILLPILAFLSVTSIYQINKKDDCNNNDSPTIPE